MLENAIIFSKDLAKVVLTSTFGSYDPSADNFANSLEKIQEIAVKLEKGLFTLDLDLNLTAMIFAIKGISIALVFNEKFDKKLKESWENVAKEVVSSFERYYESKDESKYIEFKPKLDEIIKWHQKELSPIDKMKDALW
ncbi:MAG: hypothetical protein JXA54_09985 [Candidatus Heimdallarchaeota archaeon]|nr:hypothetical protein [Candidatus Heimdallarchaeota archaeon]